MAEPSEKVQYLDGLERNNFGVLHAKTVGRQGWGKLRKFVNIDREAFEDAVGWWCDEEEEK